MRTDQDHPTTIEDQVAEYEHIRLAAYAHHTVEDLLEVARGYNIARVSDLRKADLLMAIVNHEVKGEERRLRDEARDAEAQAKGFNDAYQMHEFEYEVEKLRKAADVDAVAVLMHKVNGNENPNGALIGAIGWGYGVTEALTQQFATQLLRFVEGGTHPYEDEGEMHEARFTNPAEALEAAKDVILRDPLVNNNWRGQSTNDFSNAVEAERRDVASKMLRRYW